MYAVITSYKMEVMFFSFVQNCRENIKLLIKDINSQKKIFKERGLTVDGRHYSLHFTG